ncbi:MAG: hypothetical protein AB1546_08730 [bacterium]
MMRVSVLEQIYSMIRSFGQPNFDANRVHQDTSILGLITIIKNAHLPRSERDHLMDLVKWQAVMNPEGINTNFIKGMMQTIFFLETVYIGKYEKEAGSLPLEKTPHQEMDEINDLRAKREADKKKIDSLKNTVSKTA